MIDGDSIVASVFGTDVTVEFVLDRASFEKVKAKHAAVRIRKKGGRVIGFRGGVCGATGYDFIHRSPGWKAKIKSKRGRGAEGVVENLSEGVGGVTAEEDLGSREQGGVHAGWGEESVTEPVTADLNK